MKKFFALILSMLLFAPQAFAGVNGSGQGSGRTSAMGLTNFQTADYSNLFINPAYVVKYQNKAWGILGGYTANGTALTTGTGANGRSDALSYGGLNYGTSFGTLGLWMGRPSDSIIGDMDNTVVGKGFNQTALTTLNGGTTAYPLGTPGATSPSKNIDLLYGLDVGSMLIGARLNLNSDNRDDSASNADTQALTNFGGTNASIFSNNASLVTDNSDWGLHLGIAMKEMPIGVSLVYGMPSLDSSSGLSGSTTSNTSATTQTITSGSLSDKIKGDGASNIGLYVNGAVKMSDTVTLVPTFYYEAKKNDSSQSLNGSAITTNTTTVAGVSTSSTATGTYAGSGKRGDERSAIGVDAAFNLKPNDKTLIVTAIGFGLTTTKQSMTGRVDDNKTVTVTTTSATVYNGTYGEYQNTSSDVSGWSIPMVVGIEHNTTEKLITRMGMRADLYNSTTTKTTNASGYTTVAGAAGQPSTQSQTEDTSTKGIVKATGTASLSMGLAYKLSDSLTLNGVLNQDILFTGGYLISGVPETLFTGVTVAYAF